MTDATKPRYWKAGDQVKVIKSTHDYFNQLGEIVKVGRRNALLRFDDGKTKQVPRSVLRWVRRPR